MDKGKKKHTTTNSGALEMMRYLGLLCFIMAIMSTSAAFTEDCEVHMVQLALLGDKTSATNELKRLKARYSSILKDHTTWVQKRTISGYGTFYRVLVGPFGKREAATQMCSALVDTGVRDCLVRTQNCPGLLAAGTLEPAALYLRIRKITLF